MSFTSQLKRFNRVDIDNALEKETRKTAIDVLASVEKKTPVKTGRARGNWNVGKNMIDERIDVVGVNYLVKGDGRKPIYITNSLPYIKALENGWSKQAPRGMVAITANEYRAAQLL